MKCASVLREALNLRKVGAVACIGLGIAMCWAAARAQDAPFGCKVLLCAAASSPAWGGIPYCVPVMDQLFSDLAHGGSWPSCPEAGEAGAIGYEPYLPCPGSTVPGDFQTDSSGNKTWQTSVSGIFCGKILGQTYVPGQSNGRGNSPSPGTYTDLVDASARPAREDPNFIVLHPVGQAPFTFWFRLQQ